MSFKHKAAPKKMKSTFKERRKIRLGERAEKKPVPSMVDEAKIRKEHEAHYHNILKLSKEYETFVERGARTLRDSNTLLDQKLVEQAVSGIKNLADLMQKKKVADVTNTEGDDLIMMQVTLSKLPIPAKDEDIARSTTIKVSLPHTVVTDYTDVLLITSDLKPGIRPDHEPSLHHYKQLLQANHATDLVTEIIPLRQLKVDYREYEAKRHLANRVDVVLCDASIMRVIPKLLGKHFYKIRKIPIQVNLKAKKIRHEITRALRVSPLIFTRGNCALMKVGRISQTNKKIAENIYAAAKKLSSTVPGTWINVQNLSLKLHTSTTIPFYLSLKSLNTVPNIPGKIVIDKKVIKGEISTLPGKTVSIYPDGNVYVDYSSELKIKRKKKKKVQLNSVKASELLKANKKAGIKPTKNKDPAKKKTTKTANQPTKKEKPEPSKKEESDSDDGDDSELEMQEQQYLERLQKSLESAKSKQQEEKVDTWAEDSDDEMNSDIELME